MAKIRKKFKKSEWNDCCGKLCDDCDIVNAYIKEFRKKKGKKKFKTDHKKINRLELN